MSPYNALVRRVVSCERALECASWRTRRASGGRSSANLPSQGDTVTINVMTRLAAQPLLPDPVIEAYKKDVDRTLILEQLRRSVDERVGNMIEALRLAEELRAAGRRRRP